MKIAITPFTQANVAGKSQVASEYDCRATIAIKNLIECMANAFAVSSSGLLKLLRNVGVEPMTSVIESTITDPSGSFVTNQSNIAAKAKIKVTQSRHEKRLSPPFSAKKPIIKQTREPVPVAHAPAPAPFTICA